MLKRMIAVVLIAVGLVSPAWADDPPAFLVTASWLEEHVKDPDLVILEVRYHPHRHFTVGHIAGAVQVQRFRDLGDNGAQPIMKFPSREAFEATLRRWGVNDTSTIVLYDDARTALASRLYFLLDLYGFDMKRVKLLNGGTLDWTAFNELVRDPTPPGTGTVTLKPARTGLMVEWTDVYDRAVSRRAPSVVLLDARPREHYTGEQVVHSVRGGHIPGAVNIVSLDGTVGDTHSWRSMEELAALYRNIPKDKTVIAYCHDGFRMSLAYMQLKALGYQDVRLYNGGWSHWGNELALPVVVGAEPFDDDFRL